MRHFSSSYLLPTFELATFKPLPIRHWTSLIWKLTSILKAFTKKPILHLCTASMTAENILVAQGVHHSAFLDKMLPSQHHHPVLLGKNGTSDSQLQRKAANEAIWWFENTFASMTFLKKPHRCFMAIFPEGSSQGGYRNVYFYKESATSFKVVFNIFKCICESPA